MMFFKNLYAEIVILFSNLNAKYGLLVNIILISIVALILGTALVRATLSGRTNRKRRPIKMHHPDDALTAHASESLSRAVQFQTITGDDGAISAMIVYFKERYPLLFEKVSCVVLPGGSLLMCWRKGEKNDLKPAMFTGHLDVVPPGEGWSDDPFSGRREDGIIHGRGTLDGKNVVVALLEAVNSLIDEGYSPRRDIYFAFGHDEETGGYNGAKAIGDLLFKRGVTFECILNDGGYISKAHMASKTYPAAILGIGEKGSCYYRLTATGKPGQTDTPPIHTTLGTLSEAICRIESAPPKHKLLPAVEVYLTASTPAMPFLKRFAVANLPFSAPFMRRVFRNDRQTIAMLQTSFVPTQTNSEGVRNVLPSSADATINARLLQGDTPASILEYIRGLVEDLPIKVDLIRGRNPSKLTSPDSWLYNALCSCINDRFIHMPCIPTILTSSTDCRHYEELSSDIVRFMPFVVSGKALEALHGADEYVRENSLGTAVELYKGLMKKM